MISNWHSMIIASLAGIPAITKPEEDGAEEHVVLLHGLGRTARSMSVIGWALEQEGYRVVNIGYPSTKGSISALADRAISKAVNLCGDAHRVHFVTHSMGGILLRHWMNENALPQAGRAVMLGPPNGGSEIVDAFCDWRSFRLLHGPAGRELTTREDRGPRRLSCCAPLETGIIAGTRSLNPLTSAFIRGANDGKVSVESAFSMPAQARLALPVSHTWMMLDQEVIAQTARFLRTGGFSN